MQKGLSSFELSPIFFPPRRRGGHRRVGISILLCHLLFGFFLFDDYGNNPSEK
jgi:hypothetical protein